LTNGIPKIQIECFMTMRIKNMEELTEEDYNRMILEILQKNIEIHRVNIVLYCFFCVEFFLIFFGYISLNYFVKISWVIVTIKLWFNERKIKMNDSAITYIEDLRNKKNKI